MATLTFFRKLVAALDRLPRHSADGRLHSWYLSGIVRCP